MKKRFGQKAFLLKAVFVFFRICRRRSRRDSFLSFLLFDSDASLPLWEVIRSVTHLVPRVTTDSGEGSVCVNIKGLILGDPDRELFLATLRELCVKLGYVGRRSRRGRCARR